MNKRNLLFLGAGYLAGRMLKKKSGPVMGIGATRNPNKETMDTIVLATHKNQPMPSLFYVVKETEKAMQLMHESTGKSTWIPKSAMKINKGGYDSYTLADWFRKKMPIWQLGILQG